MSSFLDPELFRLDAVLGPEPSLVAHPVRLLVDFEPSSASDLLEALEWNRRQGQITPEEYERAQDVIGGFFKQEEIDGVEQTVTDFACIAELPMQYLDGGRLEVELVAPNTSWEKNE